MNETTLQAGSNPPSPMVESPWEMQFEPHETLEDLTVRLEETRAGIRIERIELDGIPLELKADFIDLGGIKLNLHCLPRATFAASTSETAGEKPLACWTPADAVSITHPITGETWNGKLSDDVVSMTRDEPETVVLEIDSPDNGFVILSETYRPGWQAEVDGRKQPVLRAQSAFRAVAVPAGPHRVVLSYRPASLLAGAFLSLLALLGLIVLALSKRGRPL
jgi:hypothetical protein